MDRDRSLAAVRAELGSETAGTEFLGCSFGTITGLFGLHGSEIADAEFRACSFGKVPGRADSRRPSVYTLYVLVDHVARVMVHQIRWLANGGKVCQSVVELVGNGI